MEECKLIQPIWEIENLSGPCSGNGNCVEGTCICSEGWSGRSDLISTPGFDCQLNLTAVRLLWMLNLVFSVVMLSHAAPRIRHRYQRYKEIRDMKRAQGQRFGIMNNRGMAAIFAYIFVCIPSVNLYGIIKFVNPNIHLGESGVLSFLFFTAKLGFYGAVYLFQPALLQNILRSKSQTFPLVRLADTFTLILCGFATFLALSPFLCFASNSPSAPVNFLAYYLLMAGTALQLILFGMQALYIEKAVSKVLDESYSLTKSSKVLAMKEALGDMQRQVQIQSLSQGLVYALFAFWPFLYNKHDYFLPIGWLAYHLLGKKLAYTQVKQEGKESSSLAALSSSQHSGSRVDQFGGNKSQTTSQSSPYQDSSVTMSPSVEGKYHIRRMPFLKRPSANDDLEV